MSLLIDLYQTRLSKRRGYLEYKLKTISVHRNNKFIRGLFGEKWTCNAVLGYQAVIQDKITTHVNEPSHCFYLEKTGRVNAVLFAGTLQAFLFEMGIHHKKA